MIRTPYEAGGFAFPNEAMMEKAIREEEGIRYIKESADLNNSQIIYEVYCQMVRQKIFETPVGYTFLHELQESLKADSSISLRDIPAVPVRAFKTEPSGEKREKPKEAGKVKTKVVYKKAVKNVDYKPWFRTSVTISIILLGIVIGMFAVTATSGNINIVNYENALIEKYENWETQLLEREERLKERENALR
ncbi:MAG: hypothetical protein HFI81_03545 [Eubacterium sp.]|jgi:hypothetical protein|nr:hypothetical protein [Eubacterium sp.]